MLDELSNNGVANSRCDVSNSGTNVAEKFQNLEHQLEEIEAGWKYGLSLCNEILSVDESHQGALRMRHQLTTTFFPCLLYTSPSPRDRG